MIRVEFGSHRGYSNTNRVPQIKKVEETNKDGRSEDILIERILFKVEFVEGGLVFRFSES